MQPLSIPRLIAIRLIEEWKLLLPVFVGITVASTLVAGAPIYVESLKQLGINTGIDRSSQARIDLRTFAPYVPLKTEAQQRTDQMYRRAVDRNLAPIEVGAERHLRADPYIAGTPSRPLPDAGVEGVTVALGYFQTFTNLESHVTVLPGGRMYGDGVTRGPRGPIVEGVLGSKTADRFRLRPGDTVVFAPSIAHPTRTSVQIVGIIEATNPSETYWNRNVNGYLNPGPLEEEFEDVVDVAQGEPPIAVFVSHNAMLEGVGKVYPATLSAINYFMQVDKSALKRWQSDEIRSRLDAFEGAIADTIPGALTGTGLISLLEDFEVRSFFSTVPLLLLLAVMVVTVLYYLSMMVSYLVESRTDEVALLRSRGTGTWQLLRLYSLEGLTLTAIAVVFAPFLALGAIALAGKLPYFREFTDGDLLPVRIGLLPFLVAIGAGLLCLFIFVVPGVIGGRSGLIVHKLRSSRPPSVPFFQRYYLDIGLLVLGGLVFWELNARGYLVSGGLFKDVEVNEALLLGPVLFLTVVALLFMRFFPLFVRFAAGESPLLLHLVTTATVVVLGPVLTVRGLRDDIGTDWVAPVVALAAFALAYWTSNYAKRVPLRIAALFAQAALVAVFLFMEPPSSGDLLFVPSLALIAIVPAQVLFLVLRHVSTIAPVWVSMALLHMARNPLQYGWMVLLLVLVTGLGILSTTVGGTLERSQRDQILYDVAADIRVTNVPGDLAAGTEALKELYLKIPGVTSVSLAHRTRGKVGTGNTGIQFELLGLEAQDFPYVTWYRDDFSRRPLAALMRELQSGRLAAPLEIPAGATELGLWVKPRESYPGIFLWMVIEDARGIVSTHSFGNLESSGWQRMATELPSGLQAPLRLLAIQIFEQGFGPIGTTGVILLDDVFYVGPVGQVQVLEGFEGRMDWSPLVTSALSADFVAPTTDDAHSGNRAALFSFGKDTDGGIRGIHHKWTPGLVPVVVDASLARATGTRIGDSYIAEVSGRLIPVVVRETVDYFPTLAPGEPGFMLADMGILLRHLNMLTPLVRIAPNELFVQEAPGADEAVREAIYNLVSNPSQVHDKEQKLLESRIDPLVTAGWRVMVLISVGIIIFVAGLGYVIYLMSFANRSRTEMGFLQSMGLSRRQLMGLLGLEHLVIAAIGLGLGSWAGFQMSRIMVSSLAVTSEGKEVVPPFILTTDWSFMLPIYAALVAIFLAALYSLNRNIRSLDLHEISRVEG